MKTKQANEAEIASDVKDAMRARAEAEQVEAAALKRELEREKRALEKSRKEKLATFYYGLATLFITSSGIGGLTPLLINENQPINWYGSILGIALSVFFAYQANCKLKN